MLSLEWLSMNNRVPHRILHDIEYRSYHLLDWIRIFLAAATPVCEYY